MYLLLIAVLLLLLWIWRTWPRIGHLLYNASMALEARMYHLRKVTVPIAEMGMVTYLGGPATAEKTILMLHGYSCDKTIWLRFARHFVDDYRVIIPDLAGHGETGFKAGGGYDIPTQAQRLIQLLDACQVDTVHLIGNSMGGYIAAWLAATHPERVASLALIDPAGLSSPEPSDMERMLAHGSNPFLIHSGAEFAQFYAMTMASPPWVPAVVLAALAERYQRRRDELAEIFEDFHASQPIGSHLHDIRAPALLLWGREDRLLHVSSAQVWAKGLASVRMEIWDGIGHMPMVERPGRTAQVYHDFLQALAPQQQ
ncbi:Pimeloyl-ACP methyl ester carboxylesterase [Pseudomonas sp. ok272]|uniref:alpha/beta fold hydrolase n=1 Tax=unclassified Pseudomonas TaxID=196821 RepID=UPI0008D81E91|nr:MULTISPECIES: alpha/beta fold hydrolase [unclassified Pseudomonas]SEN58957.1 Pimeloyl-ACP methyl ester carboxylesterase [Pseudomonas sp. ok272]SFN37528.1 Pimeloyl-ACP methyl ester carboxylesterase [Pseudomonas sp. ok602]